jgi:hypothetical protein
MDRDTVLQLAPHYVAMFALVLIVIGIIGQFVDDIGLLLRLVIVFVVVFSYRPLVLRLGVAPDVWEQ